MNVCTIHPEETGRETLNRIQMAQNWVQCLNFEHDIEFSICIKSGRSLHQSFKKGLCVCSYFASYVLLPARFVLDISYDLADGEFQEMCRKNDGWLRKHLSLRCHLLQYANSISLIAQVLYITCHK